MKIKDDYRKAKAEYEALWARRKALVPPPPARDAGDDVWDAYMIAEEDMERALDIPASLDRLHAAEDALVQALLNWAEHDALAVSLLGQAGQDPAEIAATLRRGLRQNVTCRRRLAEVALKAPIEEEGSLCLS